ncbi:Transmembrane protein [Pelomyxa schiedti]|nr:Transmembrane protein [Pelomyxa schiedti]
MKRDSVGAWDRLPAVFVMCWAGFVVCDGGGDLIGNSVAKGALLDVRVFLESRDTSVRLWRYSFVYEVPAPGSDEISTVINVTAPEALKNGDLATLSVSLFPHNLRTPISTAKFLCAELMSPKSPTRFLLYDPLPTKSDLTSAKKLPFWKPKLTIYVLVDHHSYPRKELSPLHTYTMEDRDSHYHPLIYVSDMSTSYEEMIEINSTVSVLPLEITIKRMNPDDFSWVVQFSSSLHKQKEWGFSHKETEDMKHIFLQTSPTFLFIIGFVSLLHIIFDILSFRNDIAYWRNLSSLLGVSVRSVIINALFRVVILAYLYENETSLLVLVPAGISVIIDIWKLFKCYTQSKKNLRPEEAEQKQHKMTSEADTKAFHVMLLVLIPLIIGYSSWSLIFSRHKGWCSWLLESLTSIAYACGFIMMTPQLFINHKLKSVEHLPWRALVYKALNTFIDDLFAFIIKMPTMHRMSCFRDDIVFIIYMYQRWLYRSGVRLDRKGCPHYNIAVFGKRGAAKSSFINAVATAFSPTVRYLCPTSGHPSKIGTPAMDYYDFPRLGFPVPVRFWDCWGEDGTSYRGETFKSYLRGLVTPGTLKTDKEHSVKKPTCPPEQELQRKMHCLLIFISAHDMENIEELNRWWTQFFTEAHDLSIPIIAVLTHLDHRDPAIASFPSKIWGPKIEELRNSFRSICVLNKRDVFPVASYWNRQLKDEHIDASVLAVLHYALQRANDHIVKVHSKVSYKLPEPTEPVISTPTPGVTREVTSAPERQHVVELLGSTS